MKYGLIGAGICGMFLAAMVQTSSAYAAAATGALPKPAVGCDQWHMSDVERTQCYKEWNASDAPSDRLAVEQKYNHAAKEDVSMKPNPPNTPVDMSVGEGGPVAKPTKKGSSRTTKPTATSTHSTE